MQTGKEGEEGEIVKKSFRMGWEAYNEIRDLVKSKLKEGYELQLFIPEGFFLERDENENFLKDGQIWEEANANSDYLGSTNLILVDLENKSEVIEKLDKGLEYLKSLKESGYLYLENNSSMAELSFFELNEETSLKEVYFFSEVLKHYPDLENKVIIWLDYAIELRDGIYTDRRYIFDNVASALVSFNPEKYIDKYLDFLNTWDWNHETDAESDCIGILIDKYGTQDIGLKAMAARRTFLAGQHGTEMEIDEYLEDMSVEQSDRFFQYVLLGLVKENKKLNDPKHAGHYQEANTIVRVYLEDILSELGCNCDKDRMIMAVANVNKENPITLCQLMDENYEFPLSSEFCIEVGHKETSKQNFDKSVAFFSKAIEQTPYSADAYLGRGYAYYCQKDMKNAELDWLKSLELFPESVTANRNLVEIYTAYNPNYEKALKHINKTFLLNNHPKSGDYILRGNIYEKLGETEKATADYEKGLASKTLTDYMAYTELKITLNQFEKALEIISDEKVVKPQTKRYNGNSYVIALFLEGVALIALKKNYAQTKLKIEEQFEKTVYNKWNFQLIDQWLKTASLEEGQKEKIQDLANYILTNRSTNY